MSNTSTTTPAGNSRPTILLHPSGNPAGKPKTPYLLNCWYAAGLSTEIPSEGMLSRKLLDTSVLMYRTADGTPVALHDRCPHRFVPLSMGKRDGDDIVCKYHALRFDCTGTCTHSPHGNGTIPKAARVRQFSLLERHGFVWIWMGDEPADPAKLPDFGALDDGPATGLAHTYMPMKTHYELIIDNVMDLSHVDHVHGEIITTRGQLSPLIPPVKEVNNTVNVRWEWQQTPAMLILANFLPDPAAAARHFLDVTWFAPATIQLMVGAVQDSTSPLDLAHTVGDGEYNQMKIQAMHGAFVNEDGPIIEAVHREMGTSDFFSLNPVLISSDAAPVRVRRLLARLIDQEGRYK